MANIDDEMVEICYSKSGSEVRSSIVNALKKINDDRQFGENKKLTVTKDQNHSTIEGGPWTEVDIDVSYDENDKRTAGISLVDFGSVTENGYYDIWRCGLPANTGWKSISVNVKDNNTYGPRTITENGVYDSEIDGLDGYSKVEVKVPTGGKVYNNFTVRFHDIRGLCVQEKTVRFGETAVFDGTPPPSDTPFVRWDPEPINVSYNMDCYPVYEGWIGGTIKDDWRTIAINLQSKEAGAKYQIGDTKEIPCRGFQRKVEMVLVQKVYTRRDNDYYGITVQDGSELWKRDDGYVTKWVTKNALCGSSIDAYSVLSGAPGSLKYSRAPGHYDGWSYSLEGAIDIESDAFVTWNAVTYYWFIIGISWDHNNEPFFPDFHDGYSYYTYKNGGTIDWYNIWDTAASLGIEKNIYLEYEGARAREVSILLESPAKNMNVLPYQTITYTEPEEEGGGTYYGALITGAEPSYYQKYGGRKPTLNTFYKLLNHDYNYRGNQYCKEDLRTLAGYMYLTQDGYGTDDTGYSRDFLIL